MSDPKDKEISALIVENEQLEATIARLTAEREAYRAAVQALLAWRRSYTPPPMRAVSMAEAIVAIEPLDVLQAFFDTQEQQSSE